MILGIDASRCRSGGSINHLYGILCNLDYDLHNITEVHIWSYKKLLIQLPCNELLKKHSPKLLNKNLFFQLFWQLFFLKFECSKKKCDILFTADASSLCSFRNQVVLSQDLLSYEPGVASYFGFGFSRLRLFLIKLLQNRAFRNAKGVIFLTNYTANLIQSSCGLLENTVVIPHGFDSDFSSLNRVADWENEIICTYVSNTEFYKHQWSVVKAVEILRSKKYNIKIQLVGGGIGRAQKKLDSQIQKSDPKNKFVKQFDFLSKSEILGIFNGTHIFVFASSCETFGITLLEAMASGLPIVCSSRSSLPEVLLDGGEYFDPEDADSIADKIELLLNNKGYSNTLSKKAKEISSNYSWKRCSLETFTFIEECNNRKENNN
jgi:glycosyltransferase involved in cell wall biosynthesis